MSLQTIYRPSSLKMFAGNKDIKSNLESVLARETPPASFLIVGPSGCGKTTLGRIIARGLGCAKSSFKEMNTANDRGLPAIRKVLEKLHYLPLKGKKKVVLFDEAHQITHASQEALLKALEEPPAHVHFIVCTTNPEALKDTFKRRCHIYEVSLLTSNELLKMMRRILSNEKVKDFPDEILDRVIELSGGSAGIALKNLDMVIDMGKDIKGALRTLKSAGTTEAEVKDICRALLNFNMSDTARWTRIRKLLAILKSDGESARRPIMGYLSKALINNPMDNNNDLIAEIMMEFKNNFYDSGKDQLRLACYAACGVGEDEEE
ncbi:MAG: AAA family ATPase [Deltaproteobacteria bacterium]|nr:AAA family ATPase [Deltaproteobacteria bacterium]